MKIFRFLISACLCAFMMFSFAGCSRDRSPDSSSAGSDTAGVTEYKDGEYLASAPNYDDQEFKATVKVVVKDGRVASIDCDALAKDGDTKKVQSENGTYSMKSGGAQHEWHEQIAYFEKYVLENGVKSVSTNGEGKTDTVTGCTIKVKDYVDLINEALDKAKK